ncbi:hypothetical protein BGZ60DRAFT_42570 [Tricladium varicosporioides]|nr:hypothetical protein BGZ60DRAFT_42570 [Hymenoscyphus varicosporioides]
MPSKIILFTGAPNSGLLKWDESGLLKAFSDPFTRFANLPINSSTSEGVAVPFTPSITEYPEWRSLSVERQHLTTGVSQDHRWRPQYEGASFFKTSQLESIFQELSQNSARESFGSNTGSIEEVLTQFYAESYARHEDVLSSQIATASDLSDSFTSGSSLYTTEGSFDSPAGEVHREIPKTGPLSTIKDIPTAVYLNSIEPQTMTVNLIVGIISLPPSRTIKTRRGGQVELVEAIVGDETKSGFGVNFWLSSSQPAMASLKSGVESLRPQDVVLMRNVALSSFCGRVYGQSLRQGMTKVHLLCRNKLNRTDAGGCYSRRELETASQGNAQFERTKKVREWVVRFVGGPPGPRNRDERDFEPHPESLPPDTQ